MNTWHLHVQGQVQGVGFRPFIYSLAQQKNIFGWVSNTIDGVHIEINADQKRASLFLEDIKKLAPSMAIITDTSLIRIGRKKFTSFNIVASNDDGAATVSLSPDFGLCQECQEELANRQNRRHGYPFISCTNCGPRYSIVEHLPYDRIGTSMKSLTMCDRCSEEYHLPDNRRYYSQTNSCPDCAIMLNLFDKTNQCVETRVASIIQRITDSWHAGHIIAIKGIGGYLLTCDASNEATIQKLRDLKYRPTKPFALLFPDLDSVKDEVILSEKEAALLQSSVAPIIILNKKSKQQSNLTCQAIAPGLYQLGVMLPYTPLLKLLLDSFKKPIVATSGNLSNAQIVFNDKKALNTLSTIADFILTHGLEIMVPQDDSVVKFSYFKKHKLILRRSRGLAPSYINSQLNLSKRTILAAGAMQKSSFTYLHQGTVFISQYLGDLNDFETEESYRHTLDHVLHLCQSQPEVVLCDLHPTYSSTLIAQDYAKRFDVTVEKIQHHQAHFASVLGEHQLVNSEEPILGVIWDGTGMGDDGHVWGGEFFLYDQYQFTRCGHVSYFDFIVADKMPKEPRLSALVLCQNHPAALARLQEKFTEQEWTIYKTLLSKEEALKCSSMGRLFDAVASLLHILDKQSYEGEAAILLEQAALVYCQEHGLVFNSSYFTALNHDCTVSTDNIISGIINDLEHGVSTTAIAAKFHYTLIKIIEAFLLRFSVEKVAFSGGVFQNGLLIDMLHHHLGTKSTLLFNRELSANDENISFGQVVYHQIQQESR